MKKWTQTTPGLAILKPVYLLLLLSLTNTACSTGGHSYIASGSPSPSASAVTEKIPPTRIPRTRMKLVAGSAFDATVFKDGPAQEAIFNLPLDVALDHQGNVFVADSNNHRVRKLSPDAQVSTVYDNSQAAEKVLAETSSQPEKIIAIVCDSKNNLFIAKYKSLWKLTPEGILSRIGESAGFESLTSIAVDKEDNLFVVDWNKIKKIDQSGRIADFAGAGKGYKNGERLQAQFNSLEALAINQEGEIYVSEFNPGFDSFRIRKIDRQGIVSTFVGKGPRGDKNGVGEEAQIDSVYNMEFAPDGNLYFLDPFNNALKMVDRKGLVSTIHKNNLSGYREDGILLSFGFGGFQFDENGNIVLADRNMNRILKLESGFVGKTIAGKRVDENLNGKGNQALFERPRGLQFHSNGQLYLADGQSLRKVALGNSVEENLVETVFHKKTEFIYNSAYVSNSLSIVDTEDQIIFPDITTNTIKFIGTDGSVTELPRKFDKPIKAVMDNFGNLYVLEYYKNHVLMLTRNNELITLAGSAEKKGLKNGNQKTGKEEVLFDRPSDLAFDKDGYLLVADFGNGTVRQINREGDVSTLMAYQHQWGERIQTGLQPLLIHWPFGLSVDKNGQIFVLSGHYELTMIDKNKHAYNLLRTDELKKNLSPRGYTEITSLAADQQNNLYISAFINYSPDCNLGMNPCASEKTNQSPVNGNYLYKLEIE